MRRVVIIIVALALFSACADNTVQRESLDGVEAIIEEDPSGALQRLSVMDTVSLRSKPLKARYALLKSMALDKTYIDGPRGESIYLKSSNLRDPVNHWRSHW